MFCYFGYDWTVVRELSLSKVDILRIGEITDSLRMGVELTRSEWQIDNISDCGDEDRCTFFEKPGGNGIRIKLLVWAV